MGACGSSKSDSNAKEGETATKLEATTEAKKPANPSTAAAKPEEKTVDANGAAKEETIVPADLPEGKKEVSMDSKTSYCYLNNVSEENGKT
ncbi:MAG: hypothetical protein JKY56_26005, partial [Kofleriaceae bacterium]|nr:hypothetical protein [Kofleriaceae bacterium]